MRFVLLYFQVKVKRKMLPDFKGPMESRRPKYHPTNNLLFLQDENKCDPYYYLYIRTFSDKAYLIRPFSRVKIWLY